jgi:hypothetical protein
MARSSSVLRSSASLRVISVVDSLFAEPAHGTDVPNGLQIEFGWSHFAKDAFCPNGSHLCMWDDQEVYFRHLLGFLRAV